MNVGHFDLRPVAFGRRVVDHHQKPFAQGQDTQHQRQKPRGNRFGLTSEGRQALIVALKVAATEPPDVAQGWVIVR